MILYHQFHRRPWGTYTLTKLRMVIHKEYRTVLHSLVVGMAKMSDDNICIYIIDSLARGTICVQRQKEACIMPSHFLVWFKQRLDELSCWVLTLRGAPDVTVELMLKKCCSGCILHFGGKTRLYRRDSTQQQQRLLLRLLLYIAQYLYYLVVGPTLNILHSGK